MPFSPALAARIRQIVGGMPHISEKRMFGGLAFLSRGNMLVAVWGPDLIVRLGVEEATLVLDEKRARPFDVTGKPMKGWVVVDAEDLDLDVDLAAWIEKAQDFVDTLPSK